MLFCWLVRWSSTIIKKNRQVKFLCFYRSTRFQEDILVSALTAVFRRVVMMTYHHHHSISCTKFKFKLIIHQITFIFNHALCVILSRVLSWKHCINFKKRFLRHERNRFIYFYFFIWTSYFPIIVLIPRSFL